MIEKLSKGGKDKQLKSLLKKYNVKVDDYPFVIENFQKKYLRYVLNSEGWMRCEELFKNFRSILVHLVQELSHKQYVNEVVSIIKRNRLHESLNIAEVKEIYDEFNSEKFEIIINQFFEYDSFNPVDENLANNYKKGTFLHLKDFGLDRKDIYFIDSIKNSDYEDCKKELMKAKFVNLFIFILILYIFNIIDWI